MSERLSDSVAALQLCTSCATHRPLLLAPSRGQPRTSWTAAFDAPAPLRGSGLLKGSFLVVRIALGQDDGHSDTVVTAYQYALRDHAGRELLAFHWHLNGRSPVAFPHLHVSSALRGTTPSGGPAVLPLDKVHLPTGHVSVADVVRLLVGDLGVAPLRADWLERLDRAAPMLPAFPA